MATVVRVKRRCEDEPAEAFVIAYKKKKEEGGNEEQGETILHFAGTVNSEDENVHKILPLKKEQLQQSYKRHNVNITNKVRTSTKLASKTNRFKVVNCYRSLDSSELKADETASDCNTLASTSSVNQVVRLVDVVPDESVQDGACAAVSKVNDLTDRKYVYDLYCTDACDVDDGLIDNLLSVQPLENNVFFDNADEDDPGPLIDDDDDSNDENNWRNDYPDSDPEFELDGDFYGDYHDATDILEGKMMKCRLDDECELSSDDGEEDYYGYSVRSDDVERYGASYARYKAKVESELANEVQELSDED